jgi:hypothetical protein
VFGAHFRPVRIHLLGDEGGETRERPLAELDMFDQHRHRIVAAHAHERIGSERGGRGITSAKRPRGARLRNGGAGQADADDEARHAGKRSTARQLHVVVGHVSLPRPSPRL